MYPDRDTSNNVSRLGYIAARDQGMVESGVTKGGKNTARSFSVLLIFYSCMNYFFIKAVYFFMLLYESIFHAYHKLFF